MSKINTRSPYYITLTATNLTQVNFDIWIYTGTKITDRTTGSLFRLSASAVNDIVTVEIAELVSDYILSTFDGDYECTNVWVDYRSLNYIQGISGTYTAFTTLGGFNGYGFFEDGASPELSRNALITSNTIYLPENTAGKLPIFAEGVGKVIIDSTTTEVTDNGNTNQMIQYLTIPANSSSVKVYDTDDTTLLKTITVNNVCEPKFTPYKVKSPSRFIGTGTSNGLRR